MNKPSLQRLTKHFSYRNSRRSIRTLTFKEVHMHKILTTRSNNMRMRKEDKALVAKLNEQGSIV